METMIQKLGLLWTINFRKFFFVFHNQCQFEGQTPSIKLLSDRFPFAADSYAHYIGRSFLIGTVAFTYSAAIMIYASIIITSCMYFESSIDDLIDSFHCIDATLSVRSNHFGAAAQTEFIEMIEYQISSVEWVEILSVNIRNGLIRAIGFFLSLHHSKLKDIAEYLNFIFFWNLLNALTTMSVSLFMFTKVRWADANFQIDFSSHDFFFFNLRILKMAVCLRSSLLTRS